MENITAFFGGIIAIALLAILLSFELAREQMLLVYVISLLIIIVAGTLVISIRGGIASVFRSIGGRASRIRRPRMRVKVPKKRGVWEGRKMERFFRAPKLKSKPLQVKNPILKKIAENLRSGKPQRKSRFSGLSKRLKSVRLPRLKIRRPEIKLPEGPKLRMPKIKLPAMPKVSMPKIKAPSMPKLPIKPPKKKALKKRLKIKPKKPPAKPPKEKPKREVKKPKPAKPVPKKPPKRVKPVPKKPIVKEALPKALVKEKIEEKPLAEAKPIEAKTCQICGKAGSLYTYYIIPLEKGGAEDKDNTILLCDTHKKEAEQGMFSEDLLRKLKSA